MYIFENVYLHWICATNNLGNVRQSNVCWYWLYHANTLGINVIWNVYVCPSAFGHTVGECTFLEIYICIWYMLPTNWGIYVSWIYVLVLDISCQHLGDKWKLVLKNEEKWWNPKENNEEPRKTMKSREKQWNTMKNSENGSISTLTANQDPLMNHPFNQE